MKTLLNVMIALFFLGNVFLGYHLWRGGEARPKPEAVAVQMINTAAVKRVAPPVTVAKPVPVPQAPSSITSNLVTGVPKISGDAQFIAFVAPENGVETVWIAPVNQLSAAYSIIRNPGIGVRQFQWTHDSRYILYYQDNFGDEAFHIHLFNRLNGEDLDLAHSKHAQMSIVDMSPEQPQDIIISEHSLDDPSQYRLYHYNFVNKTEADIEIYRHKYYGMLFMDSKYNPLLIGQKSIDGALTLSRIDPGGIAKIAEFPERGLNNYDILGVDADGRHLFTLDAEKGDLTSLVATDIATGDRRVLGAGLGGDVEKVLIDPRTRTPRAYAVDAGRVQWHALDPTTKDHLDFLTSQQDTSLDIISLSDDMRYWTVSFLSDTKPIEYYIFDSYRHVLVKIFGDSSQKETLSPMVQVNIPARDGLNLVSYLMLPPGSGSGTPPRPAAPLPLVLMVHGGPWSRDRWVFSWTNQILADHGYAVLQVNYRGSAGFGRKFLEAGFHEWGRRMDDDLLDAVNWAVNAGIADPKRIAIMGASYGGYAVLASLARNPDLYACGVDIDGPSDLTELVRDAGTKNPAFQRSLIRAIGDPETYDGQKLLVERSPDAHAQNIVRPVLIVQSGNDTRVFRLQSDRMVAELTRYGAPVTYVYIPNAGHVDFSSADYTAYQRVVQVFLSKCLGGARETLTAAHLAGSGLQVLRGAELVDGLPEALEAQDATR